MVLFFCLSSVRYVNNHIAGVYCGGVPPLPIPNRAVKPACADGTARQCGRVGGCPFFHNPTSLKSGASDFFRKRNLLPYSFIHYHNKLRKKSLYKRMQWTDRIRQVKILLVVMAILIAVASLVVSNILTRDLYEEEHKKMEI